jgi:hypothetical protein
MVLVALAAIMPLAGDDEVTEIPRPSWTRQRVLLSIGAVLVPFVVAYGWLAIRVATLPSGASLDGGRGEYAGADPISFIGQTARTLVSPLTLPLYTYSHSTIVGTTSTVAQFFLLGSAAAIALMSRLFTTRKAQTLAIGAIGAVGLSLIFLPAAYYLIDHATSTQPRFTQAAIPLFAAAISLVITRRAETIAICIVGFGFYAATMGEQLFLVATA